MCSDVTLRTKLDTIQQKARERTVRTQTIEYDLDTIVRLIDKKSIKLDPDYQRRHRWQYDTSSRLIESLILNIPIPVIFISQDIDVDVEIKEGVARYTVIDGQQRLTAIYEFFKNSFALEGLETLNELNGIKHNQLPAFLVRRLEERTIRFLRIDSTVDTQVKYDIFERLNTGSVKLEAQELRNVVARGPFNELAKRLATNANFRKIIQVDVDDPRDSPKVQKMEDVELVLRFFALRNGRYKTLRKGFKDFLTAAQKEFNELPAEKLKEFSDEFDSYVTFFANYGSPKPFAKWRMTENTSRLMSSFNSAVYDAVAVGFAEVFSATDIAADPEAAAHELKGYETLFKGDEFFDAVSGSVNDGAKIARRIEAVRDYVKL